MTRVLYARIEASVAMIGICTVDAEDELIFEASRGNLDHGSRKASRVL